MVASGSGKYLETTISPEDANALFGVRTAQPAKISVQVTKNECRYEFSNRSEFIYSYMITNQVYYTNGQYICSSPPTYNGYKYIGMTPIKCDPNCWAYNKPTITGCDAVYQKTEGIIYRLEPSVIYDFGMQVNMSSGTSTYSTTIDQNNPSSITSAFRTELLGQLLGQQSCPSSPDTVAYVKNAFEPTPLQYKNQFLADSVLNSQMTIFDAYSGVNNAAGHNSILQRFLDSSPTFGQYCDKISTPTTTSISEAYMSCVPKGTVSIPVFNLYINAETVGIGVPNGVPEILEVTTGKTSSATRTDVIVKLKNNGETDSFDVSILCPWDVSPFSTRENIGAGQTKDVLINYQGAGIIGECNVVAKSVNSASSDNATAKLFITPFCARSAPSPAHKLVYTEKGCAYICENYGVTDVFDSNCEQIQDYDRCNRNESGGCTSLTSYSGIHCSSEGRYLSTNSYLDRVEGGELAFIPSVLPHKYFITQVDNTPVCAYVDEYGYKDGVPLTQLKFDYNAGFPGAGLLTTTTEPQTQTSSDEVIPLYLILGSVGVLVIGFYLKVKK